MSRTSLQYQLPEKAGLFATVPVPYPTPGRNEVCIRTKAIALNPVDWKRHLSGVMVQSWPVVLGADAAGLVESVGEDVQGLEPGDEVLCLTGGSNRGGAFQEVITIPLHMAAKKPSFLTFEEAASMPLCYLTAAAAIVLGLHVSLPFVDASAQTNPASVLVLGGSSAVGAAAIQLLRIALPKITILTTSSIQHHAHLVSLGANKCFDRSVEGNDSELKASTPGNLGVDAILDTVAGAASQPSIFDAMNPHGIRLYSQVLTGQQVKIPDGVNSTAVQARQLFDLPGGKSAITTLTDLLNDGTYKLPVKIEVVGEGLDAIQQGLETLRKGVSGTKCVVSL